MQSVGRGPEPDLLLPCVPVLRRRHSMKAFDAIQQQANEFGTKV